MVTFIKNYKTEDDVEADNIKLGTGFYLLAYAIEKIDDDELNYPFFTYKDSKGDNWILEKQDVENKTFEEFNERFQGNKSEEDIKFIYNKAIELYFEKEEEK